MKKKVGIRREDKNKWERRVPITPEHVRELTEKYGVKFIVQPSRIRVFSDAEYESAGATVQEDLSDCPVIFSVKEVPVELLQSCLLYTSPSPRDLSTSRMPSSA